MVSNAVHATLYQDVRVQLAGLRLPGKNACTACTVCIAMLTWQECMHSSYGMYSNADLIGMHAQLVQYV